MDYMIFKESLPLTGMFSDSSPLNFSLNSEFGHSIFNPDFLVTSLCETLYWELTSRAGCKKGHPGFSLNPNRGQVCVFWKQREDVPGNLGIASLSYLWRSHKWMAPGGSLGKLVTVMSKPFGRGTACHFCFSTSLKCLSTSQQLAEGE